MWGQEWSLGCCNHCWLVFWGLSWCQFECEWLRLVWTHQLTIYLWAPHLFLATETQTSSVRWNSNYDGAGRGDAVMRDDYDEMYQSPPNKVTASFNIQHSPDYFQIIFPRSWSPDSPCPRVLILLETREREREIRELQIIHNSPTSTAKSIVRLLCRQVSEIVLILSGGEWGVWSVDLVLSREMVWL